jgi:hypothetical protein
MVKSLQNPQEAVLATVPGSNARLRFITHSLLALAFLIFGFSISASSQCSAPTLTFNTPKMLSGTHGTVGAIYLFENVIPGVDCHVEIMDIVGGAGLTDIDNTDMGYYDAFQPYVLAGAYDTSFLDWKFTFKVAGTFIDTTLACLAVTAIDVDGNNMNLKEFVEAATPGSFAVDPFTNLVVSFDGVRSKAEGQITTIPLIDTNQRQAMFQMNFVNINSLLYRNGAITTGDTMTRHTCIYFKPFFQNWIVLPVKLLSFNANEQAQGTTINWTATSEQDTKYYTIQKSEDGKVWKDIYTVNTIGGNAVNKYSYLDNAKARGITYYRLRQTAVNGSSSYSKIVKTGNGSTVTTAASSNTIFTDVINIAISNSINKNLVAELHAINGNRVKQQEYVVQAGSSSLQLYTTAGLSSGIYLLSVKDKSGNIIYRTKVYKN